MKKKQRAQWLSKIRSNEKSYYDEVESFTSNDSANIELTASIAKTGLFKYNKNFTAKKKKKRKKKSDKILIFFHISAQNIHCGYSLEPP